jgi:hypothetical protein
MMGFNGTETKSKRLIIWMVTLQREKGGRYTAEIQHGTSKTILNLNNGVWKIFSHDFPLDFPMIS